MMKRNKSLLSLLLTGTVALGLLAGCSGSNAGTSDATGSTAAADNTDAATAYKIGIVQLVEHNALDAATQGFQDKLTELLGDRVTFDLQNAQGEQSTCPTIVTKFVNDGVDLIMANATPAAQAASAATSDIPIIGTSITDYVEAGLVESNDAPGRNLTGTSDMSDIAQHVSLTQTLCPDAQTIGIIYCSSEDNSRIQADQAEEAFAAANMQVTRYTAADSNEIQTVVTKATSECDVLYIPTDNLFAANMEIVKNITVPEKKPVICGEENMALSGGLATCSINYYTLGEKAGEMAYDVLENGVDVGTIPVGFMSGDELSTVINNEVAEAIGIEIPAELQQ